MEFLLESSLRATVIAATIALIIAALRIQSAAVRHCVWLAATVVMLALPAVLALGARVAIPLIPPDVTLTAGVQSLDARAAEAASVARAMADVPEHSTPDRGAGAILFGLYLIGVIFLLLRLVVGVIGSRQLVRRSVLIDGRLTAACTTPMTIGCLAPRVILPMEWPRWPSQELDLVLAHEYQHVLRRDPLWHVVALVNRAVFWFHPLAWWMERHLSRLAEEACDAAVVSLGHDREAYAASLLTFARRTAAAGGRVRALGMSMPGTGLPQRIYLILEDERPSSVSAIRQAWLALACAVVIGAFATGVVTKAQPQDGAAGEVFDVASIKVNTSRDSNSATRMLPGGVFSATNATLKDMITAAYVIPDARLEGGPDWIARDRYDVTARPAEPVPGTADPITATTVAGYEPVRQMLRALLADRFRLVVHRETREVSAYRLVFVKEATGLKPNRAEACVPACGFINSSPSGRLTTRKIPINRLAAILSNVVGRPIVEATNLKDFYDVDLTWAPEAGQFGGTGRETADDTRPSLFTALEEQLGLKLETTKAPIEILVVDGVERPTAN